LILAEAGHLSKTSTSVIIPVEVGMKVFWQLAKISLFGFVFRATCTVHEYIWAAPTILCFGLGMYLGYLNRKHQDEADRRYESAEATNGFCICLVLLCSTSAIGVAWALFFSPTGHGHLLAAGIANPLALCLGMLAKIACTTKEVNVAHTQNVQNVPH
jgi:hypothetical protein